MQSDDRATIGSDDFTPELRLHPCSWLFKTVGYLKAFVVPLIVATIVGSSRDFSLWAPAGLLVPMIGVALWQQWTYRYGFSPDGLVIHEGLIFRNVRKIDYARIENVDTERGLLHRVLNVADVRVETSTGGGAEARIRVLALDAVEDMRANVFARGPQHADAVETSPSSFATEQEETLLALGPGEIVRFGLIDNRGMIVVAAALGLLAQGGFFENLDARAGPLLDWLPWRDFASLGLVSRVLLVVVTAIALIVGMRALSILLAFAMLFDFRLTRTATDLHTRYGLLTRISRTLRQPRIQAVHQTATLLHRVFERVSLRVDLAGGPGVGTGASQQDARNRWRDLWLAPLCPRDDAERLIRVALPQVSFSGLLWHTLAPRARWRIFRTLSLWWFIGASVPSGLLIGWWTAALLPAALPLIWLHSHLYVKHTGWALNHDFFVVKRGWLTRKLAVVRRDRIQSVRLRESPFDRRYRMTKLHVDNAGATASSHRFALSYLDRNDAERLAYALCRPPLANGGELPG
jgi:putative membrane protein